MEDLSELLRDSMRCWTAGVSIVTSIVNGRTHGMTVNSFTSVSLEPPIVTLSMNNGARTQQMVRASGVFAVTILAADQAEISDRFAGKIGEEDDRFAGLETFSLSSGAPLIAGGLAWLDCKVIHTYQMPHSTLFAAQVIAGRVGADQKPLVYHNRAYHEVL
jgi:flavin reductase (DIM6/NTAB) family NADH-FMN oxidoreductase RutF